MAKVLGFFRGIRNHWKKSLVGAAALSYGVSYSKEIYDTEQLMREYCEGVVKYGDAPLPTNLKPRHVTIILNPAAKKRKAKDLFDNYCAPLLHLAGISVTLQQPNSSSEARNMVMNLDTPTDAIIVAGGDGTLTDVLTGLMRRYQSDLSSAKQCPIGILPLGAKNKVANSLYQEYDDLQTVRKIVEATMAIINDKCKMMDVIEIEPIETDGDEVVKPTYAMGAIEWGAWKDGQAKANKYWYWGSLRKYATYVFNGYKQNLNWNCNAVIKYTDPCSGCSRCYKENNSESMNTNRRWWHAFIPKQRTFAADTIDYSKIENDQCGVIHEIPISTTELHIETCNINKSQFASSPRSLKLQSGPKTVDYITYVKNGWKQENEDNLLKDTLLEAKTIELFPQEVNDERMFYIDNDEYTLKPIKIKLHTQSVKVFCPEPGT